MALLALVVLLTCLCLLTYILITGYKKRSHVNDLQKRGIAIALGWSWWTGHLLVLHHELALLPPNASVFIALQRLCSQHPATEAFILDLWPAARASLIVFGPESSLEVSTKFNLPKPESQIALRRRIIGGQSILTMNGGEWKRWRTLFNPGFSAQHVAKLTPGIVQSAETFCEILRERTGRGVFRLESVTTRFTMEVISKVALGMDTDNQHSEHELSYAFNSIVKWNSYWNTSILLKPVKLMSQIYHGKRLEAIISTHLENRYQEMLLLQEEGEDQKKKSSSSAHPVSIMALALRDYITEQRQKGITLPPGKPLDPTFAKLSSNQIRAFLMAGNDSTSATLIYIYHMLSQHPSTLQRLRNEHDELFGPHPEAAALALKSNPALLNQCRYTLAVIKETLRLFPPASTHRSGLPGVYIKDLQGSFCPTEDLDVLVVHRAVHLNPRIWAKPNEFLPERWLAETKDELHVEAHAGAFRPFEMGPRNCVAQTLVYAELTVVLVATARLFDVVPAYEEWDARQQGNMRRGVARWWRQGSGGPGIAVGGRAYPTSRAGGYPAEGYPCRVSVRQT